MGRVAARCGNGSWGQRHGPCYPIRICAPRLSLAAQVSRFLRGTGPNTLMVGALATAVPLDRLSGEGTSMRESIELIPGVVILTAFSLAVLFWMYSTIGVLSAA